MRVALFPVIGVKMKAKFGLSGALSLGLLLLPVFAHGAPLNLCSVSELWFSPTGKYVYYRDYREMRLIETDCLLKDAWRTCEAGIVPTQIQTATVFFSDNDSQITTTTARVMDGTSGSAHDWVETYSTQAIMGAGDTSKGYAAPSVSIHNGGDGTRSESFFDVSTGSGNSLNALDFVHHYRQIIGKADRWNTETSGVNSRNIYGAISGARYVYLHRDNQFDMYVTTNTLEHKFLARNGNTFYEHQNNIPFKFDKTSIYGQVAGSVITLEKGEVIPLTASGSRQQFINGDDPLWYYGYFDAYGVDMRGVGQTVESGVLRALRANAGRVITNLAINNATDASILSYQGAPVNFDAFYRDRTAFTHVLTVGTRTVTLGCQDDGLTRSVEKVGAENPIWVESYRLPDVKKTVLYIHGGPVEYQASADTAQINLFLRHGYNVDVINYGSTNYNLDTSTRMYRSGRKSLESDAANIEAYIADSYPKGADLTLYQESFGGVFYRYFSSSFIEKFGHVVLYAPRGSDNVARYPDVIKAYALKTYGPELYNDNLDKTYFDALKSCQLKSKTLLLAGDKDDAVNPDYDYRFCFADPRLTLVRHAGGHDGASKDNFDVIFNYLNTGPDAISTN